MKIKCFLLALALTLLPALAQATITTATGGGTPPPPPGSKPGDTWEKPINDDAWGDPKAW